jgi:hypothetical protein
MHGGQSANHGKIADAHMAAKSRVIGHDNSISNLAVMGNMAGHHEQPIIANPRFHAAAFGAWIHGYMFADRIILSDNQAGIFTMVFQILRRMPYGCKGENPSSFADCRLPFNDDMRMQNHVIAKNGMLSDNGVWSDPDIFSNGGFGMDDCCRVDEICHDPIVKQA